jgi:hypothetical protein
MPAVQTISSSAVIAKIIRDFRPTNTSWTGDAYEMVGEAIRGIGSYFASVETGIQLNVEEGKVALPCHLDTVLGVSYKGCRLPRNGSLRFHNPCKFTDHLPVDANNSYTLNPGYIHTSFEEGCIVVYCKTIPLDCKGFPLIPDNFEFIGAVEWYIVMLLTLRGDISQIPFEKAEARWEDKRWRAKNSVDFPDIDDMELFMRGWNSVIIDTGKVQRFFEDTTFALSTDSNIFESTEGSLIIA